MSDLLPATWDSFEKFIIETKRPGSAQLLEWLDTKTDFKTAPASSKYHLNIPGGLLEHSLNVRYFAEKINEMLMLSLPQESLNIAALLHDLCKVQYYIVKQKWDAEHKEATGQWRKMDFYAVEDQAPWGHGEKSVILALRHIELTDEEITAIRWHMAFSDTGVHFSYPSGQAFRDATARHPLAKVIAMADQMAECFETKGKVQ